ncbi:hypothetical protein [Trinickia dinghuensis]|uniref:Uncharacterized protein n=1 Tax=Trinickia dinghuensis TaxID=2291023 RepID=A0A3D8JNV7_9BURK|nr:hypothetical protein [Trinickia dinghuensis]RDU94707.1 hypothetical protein DWV00_32395 [Trinickia dinghuensis]
MTAEAASKTTKKTSRLPKPQAAEVDATKSAKPAGEAEAGKSKRAKSVPKSAPNGTQAVSATADAVAGEESGKGKLKRAKKEKVVRDSFTMPQTDYERIALLKRKCLDAGVAVKKSELLRAGLQLLEAAPPKRLLAAISALEAVKTGRPAKGE